MLSNIYNMLYGEQGGAPPLTERPRVGLDALTAALDQYVNGPDQSEEGRAEVTRFLLGAAGLQKRMARDDVEARARARGLEPAEAGIIQYKGGEAPASTTPVSTRVPLSSEAAGSSGSKSSDERPQEGPTCETPKGARGKDKKKLTKSVFSDSAQAKKGGGKGNLFGESDGEAGSESSNDEAEEEEQVGLPKNARHVKLSKMSSAEVDQMKDELATNGVQSHEECVHLFRDAAEMRDPEMLRYLDMSAREAAAARDKDGKYLKYDSWIRVHINLIIVRTAAGGRVFISKERDLAKRVREESLDEAQVTGHAMFKRFDTFLEYKSAREIDGHKKMLASKDYFTLGVSEMETKAKGYMLREDFYRLPRSARAENGALITFLLSKIPDLSEDSNRTYAQRLTDEIYERDAEGGAERSFDTLLNMIAVRLSTVLPSHVAAFHTREGGDRRRGGEKKDDGCFNCGRKEGDGQGKCPGTRDCVATKCPKCGFQSCRTCATTKWKTASCSVCVPTFDPKEQLNAHGKKVPRHIMNKHEKRQKEYVEAGAGAGAPGTTNMGDAVDGTRGFAPLGGPSMRVMRSFNASPFSVELDLSDAYKVPSKEADAVESEWELSERLHGSSVCMMRELPKIDVETAHASKEGVRGTGVDHEFWSDANAVEWERADALCQFAAHRSEGDDVDEKDVTSVIPFLPGAVDEAVTKVDAAGAGGNLRMMHNICILRAFPFEKVTARAGIGWFLLDTGADCNLETEAQMLNFSVEVLPAPQGVGGIGGKAEMAHKLHQYAGLVGTRGAFALTTYYSPDALQSASGGSVNVLSHHYLSKVADYTVVYEPELMVFKGLRGACAPIHCINGAYYVQVAIGSDKGAVEALLLAKEPSTPILESGGGAPHALPMVARKRNLGDKQLWAARFMVDAAGLQKAVQCVDGLDLSAPTLDEAAMINNDVFLRMARMETRHRSLKPAKAQLNNASSARVFQLDCFGPFRVASPHTGYFMVFLAVDEASGFWYQRGGKLHTTPAWAMFGKVVVFEERAHGHTVVKFKADAESAFGKMWDSAARMTFQRETGAILEVAGGGDHDFVGCAEAVNKLLTLKSEMAMQRAQAVGCSPAFAIDCRLYVGEILLCLAASRESKSRVHLHTGRPASVRGGALPLFFATVIIATPRDGQKGSREGAHARLGQVIGKDATGFNVWDPETRTVVHRDRVDPINESAMISAGVAASMAMVDKETQVELSDLSALQLLSTPTVRCTPTKEIVKLVMPTEKMPVVGDRIEQLWLDGKGELFRRWPGAIEKVEERTTETVHFVRFDAAKETQWVLNLAKDQLGVGAHPWKPWHVLPPPEPKPVPPVVKAPAPAPPVRTTQRVTRAAAKGAAVMLVLCDRIMDDMSTSEAEKAAAIDCLAENKMGFEHDLYDAEACDASGGGAAARCLALKESQDKVALAIMADREARERDAPHMLVLSHCAAARAPARTVAVTTARGTKVEFVIPRNLEEMKQSPQSVHWEAAAKAAFDTSLLQGAGNAMVPLSEVEQQGHSVAQLVLQLDLKIDKTTGKLKKFKARLCVDESWKKRARGEAGAKWRGELERSETWTMPADDLMIKVFLANVDAADVIVSIDWTDAYTQGLSQREPRYYLIPSFLGYVADDGGAMVLVARSPIWGEGPAGREFEERRDDDMEAAGLDQNPLIPALFVCGPMRAVAVIDDVLVSAPNLKMVMDLVDFLNRRSAARGGKPITHQVAPSQFAGMMITRSPCGKTLTISMPEFAVKAALQYLPTLVHEGRLPEGVKMGKPLRKQLDELISLFHAIDPEKRRGKLSAEQKVFQAICGSVRWLCKTQVRLARVAHMLSCVNSFPPGELAVQAAKGVLAEAFVHRAEGITFGGAFADPQIMGNLKGSMNKRVSDAILKDGSPYADTGAPKEVRGHADASWSVTGDGKSDVYCLAITQNGGCLAIQVRKIGPLMASSTQTEGYASGRVADLLVWTVELNCAMGCAPKSPPMLCSDNESNLRIASGQATVSNAKHALRRWAILVQRVKDREVRLGHVNDAQSVVDFGTKWVDEGKTEMSVAHLSNSRARALFEGAPMLPAKQLRAEVKEYHMAVAQSVAPGRVRNVHAIGLDGEFFQVEVPAPAWAPVGRAFEELRDREAAGSAQ